MKTLIQRQLYRPGLVLPLMGLTRLLVLTDFSLTLAGFILLMRGSRGIMVFLLRLPKQGVPQLSARHSLEVKRDARPSADCSSPSLCCGH